MKYLTSGQGSSGCVFCHKLEEECDRENLVLDRGRHSAIVMNLYPYNSGHLMVIPYAHVPSLEQLPDEVLLEMMHLVNKGCALLRRVMSPHGFNIGVNVGKAAGAGIEEHVHVHVVPRWEGDTNFMQVCAQTRVIPEMLPETYDKLAAALQEMQS